MNKTLGGKKSAMCSELEKESFVYVRTSAQSQSKDHLPLLSAVPPVKNILGKDCKVKVNDRVIFFPTVSAF